MSLINQVLHDLDKRQAGMLESDVNGNAVSGLAYSDIKLNKSNSLTKYKGVLLWVLILAALIFFAFKYYSSITSSDEGLIEPVRIVQTNHIVPLEVIQPKEVTIIRVENQASIDRTDSTVEHDKPVEINGTIASSQTASSVETIATTQIEKHESIVTEEEGISQTSTPVKKTSRPLAGSQQAEIAYQNAYQYLGSGQALRAEQELKQGLSQAPGHIKCRELLVGLMIKQGRWLEASVLLEEGMRVNKNHAVFVKLYARTLMQLKRETEAIEILTLYAPNVYEDPDHYALLAALYQRQNNHQAAVQVYGQILNVRPESGIWWVGLGISLEAMGKTDQALAAYKSAQKSGTLNADIAKYTDNRLLALDEINYPID